MQQNMRRGFRKSPLLSKTGHVVSLGILVVVVGRAAVTYSFAQSGSPSGLTNQVKVEERNGFRYITSNGIPNHATGQFPNQGNPSRISAQRHSFRVPLSPKPASKITILPIGKFGIAVNGIPFDPSTAEWWNNDPSSGWHQAARAGTDDLGIDQSNAHVQPDGAYHYHGIPAGLVAKLQDSTTPKMLHVGWAADGFPIYALNGYTDAKDNSSTIVPLRTSYRLKQGTRPSGPGGTYDGMYEEDYQYVAGAGDLDECNGRFGVTPEFPQGTYYYVLTKGYPYVPHAFRGTPDSSFGPPGGGRRPGPGGFNPGPGGRPPFGPPGGGPPPFGPPPGGPPPFGPPFESSAAKTVSGHANTAAR